LSKFFKHTKLIGVICILSVFVIGINIYFFNTVLSNNDNIVRVEVYFKNPATRTIESEVIYIEYKEEDKIIETTMQIFNTEPQNINLSTAANDNIEVKSLEILSDDVALVQFSNSYFGMNNIEELFYKAALVWTLTSLDFINSVSFDIEGIENSQRGAYEFINLDRSNVLINPSIASQKSSWRSIKLYFKHPTKNYLVSEHRIISVNPLQPIESYIVKHLIEGPTEDKLARTVTSEAQILEVSTEEGICFVNLSSEFVSRRNIGPYQDIIAIYSIVNSLTELENVNSVQFLIDSEKVEYFGNVNILMPISRNEYIIYDAN
jgi:germination protein M